MSLPLLLILSLALLFFSGTTGFSFISEDFFHLNFKSLHSIYFPAVAFNHYIPVFLSVLYFLRKIFGLNPFPFHLAIILLHLLNTGLVYLLAKKLLKGNKAIIAAALFSFNFEVYETVFWVTGMGISLMLFFCLLSINCLINYVRKKDTLNLVLLNLLSILSFLSHEYGISVLFVFAAYLAFFGSKKFRHMLSAVTFVPLLVLFMVSVWKISLNQSLTPQTLSVWTFSVSLIKGFNYSLLPFPYILDKSGQLFHILLFIFLSGFVLKISSKYRELYFLLLWLMGDILLVALTSLPQARYYYFISIPAFLLILDILYLISKKIFLVYSLLVILQGIIFLNSEKYNWEQSGKITSEYILKINRISRTLPVGKNIYLVDFPDSTNGPPWHAFLFRHGLPEAENLYYGFDPRRIIFISSGKTDYLSKGVIMSPQNMEKLKESGNYFYEYQ